MKTTFIFILMIHWSLIILAPVLAKNKNINQPDKIILPNCLETGSAIGTWATQPFPKKLFTREKVRSMN